MRGRVALPLAATAMALASLAVWTRGWGWPWHGRGGTHNRPGRGTEVIYESNNADAPVAMSEDDLRAFASTGRGGFAYKLNQVANFTRACLSSHDGIIIPLSPSHGQYTGASDRGHDHDGGNRGGGAFKDDGWLRQAQGMPSVLLPRVMEFEDFVQLRNVKHVRGAAAAVNCFRCDLSCRNPAHHLMGYSDLFLGGLLHSVPRLTSLVFHQCPHRRLYDLGALYWEFVAKRLTQTGRWRGEARTNMVTIGDGWRSPMDLPAGQEDVVCFDELYAMPWTPGNYLTQAADRAVWQRYVGDFVVASANASGSRGDHDVDALRGESAQGAHSGAGDGTSAVANAREHARRATWSRGFSGGRGGHDAPSSKSVSPPEPVASAHGTRLPPLRYKLHERLRGGVRIPLNCSHACTDGLRIGVWHRTEGHPRHIANRDAVVALLSGYTRVQVKIYSLNSETPAAEQLADFDAFDVMVTTHGSHMGNMVFTAADAVVVELMSAVADASLCSNGQMWTKGWLVSAGHAPADASGDVHEPARRHMAECQRRQRRRQAGVGLGVGADAGVADEPLAHGCTGAQFKNLGVQANLTRLKEDVEMVIAVRCGCQAGKAFEEFGCPSVGDWGGWRAATV